MSKAILVMDMPENCTECPMHDRSNYCFGYCPLKEMPEKLKYHDGVFNAQVKGWNACIDQILDE